jgi:uncharacterized protein with HEPN domain
VREKQPDRDLAEFVLTAIERVERYNYRGRRRFLEDEMTRAATLWNLHTLAEACVQLSADVKTRYAEVDWRGIADFRNILAHNILDLSPRSVWKIIEDHLPPLKRQVAGILAGLP